MTLVFPLTDTFFNTLHVNEALITVRGPWISMVRFSHSLASFGYRWLLGPTSSDAFTLQSSSTSKAGHCLLSFTSFCSMGPALSSLRLASTHHPQLEFLLGYRDPYDGLEMHLFFDGCAQALEPDGNAFELSVSSQSLELWTQTDHACQYAMEDGGALDASWFSIIDALESDTIRPAMILMAGLKILPFKDFSSRFHSLETPWSWTRSPWTPSPPWNHDPYVSWLDDLSLMAADSNLAHSARQAAATKAVLVTDQMARIDPRQACDAVAFAMPIFLPSNLVFWTDALSKLGRDKAASAFALALSKTHTPLCHLFSAQALFKLMLDCSANAGELLSCASWGYDVGDMEWLSRDCPLELSHFFERRVLQDETPFGHTNLTHLQSGRL